MLSTLDDSKFYHNPVCVLVFDNIYKQFVIFLQSLYEVKGLEIAISLAYNCLLTKISSFLP